MTNQKNSGPGPSCPRCGELAGLSRLFYGLGKPFDCGSCGTSLIVPKGRNALVGISGFIAFWRADRTYDGWSLVIIFLIIAYVIFIIGFFTMRPKLANPESHR